MWIKLDVTVLRDLTIEFEYNFANTYVFLQAILIKHYEQEKLHVCL